MQSSRLVAGLFLASFFAAGQGIAQTAMLEPVDQEVVDQIKTEGLENSHVMEYASWMTDVFGARLTGSPTLDAASDWAVSQFKELGLSNAGKEAWGPFGRGWEVNHVSMAAHSEYGTFIINAYPKAWSPGTDGPKTGEVVMVKAESEADLAKYKGTLAGKIVLMQDIRDVEEPFEPIAERSSDSELLQMSNAVPREPGAGFGGRRFRGGQGDGFNLQRAITQLIWDEKPMALIDRGSKGEYGTIFVSSASVPPSTDTGAGGFASRGRASDVDAPETLPQFTMSIEHYNRLVRMLDKGVRVNMDVDLDVSFFDDDPMEYNVTAEIPGTDPVVGDEVVMIGAHYDSWHAGTGATDNASGSAVMMEVMRILKAVYAQSGSGPRRTIRIGLWTGEEQGLNGSRAYVNDHFAESAGRGQPLSEIKPEHAKFSAYYNLDNGTGRIRGVYMQGNQAVEPIFARWLEPFHDMGAATLTINNTSGTDHLSFDGVGLPGFQFIQDTISYNPKTHHSNMDTYDHLVPDDLMQAATIVASFVYHTSERDGKLPRKPMPVPPGEGATSSN